MSEVSDRELHVTKRIRQIEEHIKSAEDRIAQDQILIGNFKHERAPLFEALSADAKKLLYPPPAPAPPPKQDGPVSPQEKPKKEKTNET